MLVVGASLVAGSQARAALTGTPVQIASGLATPWEIQPLPDGKILITELPGRVRLVQNGTLQAAPVLTASAGHLKYLGLALDPAFGTNSRVYLYQTYTTGGGCSTALSSPCKSRIWRYTWTGSTLNNGEVIFDNIPSDGNHDGGRLEFGPDGKLYVTTGDIHNHALPQDLSALNGKILRMNPDGSPVADNPFPSPADNRRWVWSLGHRHPQGITWAADGQMYESEHGPSGEQGKPCCRDEVNRIVKGGNYGWPTYVSTDTHPAGYIAPIAHSGTSTWAPSGAAIAADGVLYVPTLSTSTAGHRLKGFALQNGAVAGVTDYFAGTYGRLRTTTASGNDLYFGTSNGGSTDQVRRVSVVAAPWSSQYVRFSGYPTIAPGEETTVYVDYRNTGSQTWQRGGANPVRLGTNRPLDRASPFYNSSGADAWISPSRPTTFAGTVDDSGNLNPDDTAVETGEVARFRFTMTAPPATSPTTYHEHFRLVAEGATWLEDYGVFWAVTVPGRSYTYSYAGGIAPPATMVPGQRATVRLDLQNTGTATWRSDTLRPFRLGTSHPMNRLSAFANETWLSAARLELDGRLAGGSFAASPAVAPGEIARFEFDWGAPATGGTYREYFEPLNEAAFWLGSIGLFYQTQIPATSYDYQYVSSSPTSQTIARDGTTVIQLQLRNTGSASWPSSGPNAVKLGTANPRDRDSLFSADGSAPGWLQSNRVKLKQNLTDTTKNVGGETTVGPNEIGLFEFTLQAPNFAVTRDEYFIPLAEGITWMRDVGIYWRVSVP